MEINSLPSPAIGNTSSKVGKQPAAEGALTLQQPEGSNVSFDYSSAAPNLEVSQSEIDKVNQALSQFGLGVSFSVDETTQSSVVKVIDKTTDEVIKQYPNESALRMMQNIQQYLESVQKSGLSGKEGLTGSLFNEII